MKKGNIYSGYVERIDFPNKGIVICEDGTAVVKDCIPMQKISFCVKKKHRGRAEGLLTDVIERSPYESEAAVCTHFFSCGGCSYQTIPYDIQLEWKEQQVKRLLDEVVVKSYEWQPITQSPAEFEYRNKMEFSFGNSEKGGPLTLGLHKKGSFYDILTTEDCKLVDSDFRRIIIGVLEICKKFELTFFHKVTHIGYLRHLLVRKAKSTGEILVCLITSSQEPQRQSEFLDELKKMILNLPLAGTINGILHTVNDSLADVIKNDHTDCLYGEDRITEKLLGLQFEISTFSFFQTNSAGAEVLYQKVRDYVNSDGTNKESMTVFDLYSGTGTIAQMLAPVVKSVIGVEIINEAVEAARVNATRNGLNNCRFIAGDVLDVLSTIDEHPDYIILDPPRDGIHPKALNQIIQYGVNSMVYISCKPTSLARDLVILQEAGYRVVKAGCVDMFPQTPNVETVCLLSKLSTGIHIEEDLALGDLDVTSA